MVRRCPKSLDAVYWKAVNWFADFKRLGVLPLGARHIEDLPAWLIGAWREIDGSWELAKTEVSKREAETATKKKPPPTWKKPFRQPPARSPARIR